MPRTPDGKYYDFEEIFFEKDCDIDSVINIFFLKYKNDITGGLEYIKNKIKNTINEDRNYLNRINSDGQDYLNRIGKTSFIKHHVIPDQNNGKEYYIYSINTFI